MSTSAVVMMLVAMVILWGGLALAVVSLSRSTRRGPTETRRDL